MAWSAARKLSFWLCVTVAGLSAGAFLCTVRYSLGYEIAQMAVGCFEGRVAIVHYPSSHTPSQGGWVVVTEPSADFAWLPIYSSSWGKGLSIPLWIPFLLASIGAFVIYRRSAKTGPNSCGKCSYDLTGNTSGVCPECGTKGNNSSYV